MWKNINENVFSSVAIFGAVFLLEKYFKTLENCRQLVQKAVTLEIEIGHTSVVSVVES